MLCEDDNMQYAWICEAAKTNSKDLVRRGAEIGTASQLTVTQNTDT